MPQTPPRRGPLPGGLLSFPRLPFAAGQSGSPTAFWGLPVVWALGSALGGRAGGEQRLWPLGWVPSYCTACTLVLVALGFLRAQQTHPLSPREGSEGRSGGRRAPERVPPAAWPGALGSPRPRPLCPAPGAPHGAPHSTAACLLGARRSRRAASRLSCAAGDAERCVCLWSAARVPPARSSPTHAPSLGKDPLGLCRPPTGLGPAWRGWWERGRALWGSLHVPSVSS